MSIEFDAETHTYMSNGIVIPSVTQVIAAAGLMGSWEPDPWYMQRGTAIHAATELQDARTLDPDSVDPRIAGYLKAFLAYRADSGIRHNLREQIVYNATHGYAGRVDMLGDDGTDIKTGAPAPWHVVQCAAYANASTGIGKPWRCLYLREDGTYRLETYKTMELYDGWRVFAAALTVYQWKQKEGVK